MRSGTMWRIKRRDAKQRPTFRTASSVLERGGGASGTPREASTPTVPLIQRELEAQAASRKNRNGVSRWQKDGRMTAPRNKEAQRRAPAKKQNVGRPRGSAAKSEEWRSGLAKGKIAGWPRDNTAKQGGAAEGAGESKKMWGGRVMAPRKKGAA